jgi:hypothetical protein
MEPDPVTTILDRLAKWGAYRFYEARTGSVYIKFPHWKLGSIRIADHPGKQYYKYRWNLHATGANLFAFWQDGKVRRLHFSPDNLEKFFKAFEEEAETRGVKPGDKEDFPK